MVLRIRERREELGLSQRACAALLGVAQNVLSQWENEVSLPRTRDLPLLAKVLDCSIDELFVPEGSEDPPMEEYTA